MTYLNTVAEDAADEDLAGAYSKFQEHFGYVPNYLRLYSLNLAAFRSWQGLAGAIAGAMDARRFELATLAAATTLECSYCSLAHGKTIQERFHTAEEVVSILKGAPEAALDDADRAVMDLAAQVARDANSVRSEDIGGLRDLGFSDADIFNVILAAAARSFFAKVVDAAGALPDRAYLDLEPELREALTFHHQIEGE